MSNRRGTHIAAVLSAALVSVPVLAQTGGGAIIDEQPTGQRQLPDAAQCYFEGVAAGGAEEVANCSSSSGVVINVGRRIEGREAIHAWVEDEVIGGLYEVLEVTPREGGFTILVTFAPEGTGAFRENYSLDIEDGFITRADLTYA